MKSEVSKSLEEVREMKEAVWEAFKKSGFTNFAEFIADEMIELRKKYNFNFNIERKEQDKQTATA